jgi:hypothetical protein
VAPVQDWLVELLCHRSVDFDAAVHLVDVSGTGGSESARHIAAQKQHRVTDPLGSNQGVRRPGRSLLEQRRHQERDKDVVEDPHDGGVVTRGFGDGDGLVGQSLAAFERAAVGKFRTQSGEHERPVGVSAGEPTRAISKTWTLSASMVPTVLKNPRSLARAAATRRFGVTEISRPPSSTEEGVTKGGVSCLALGGAEPDGQVDTQDGVGVGEPEGRGRGLGVVAESFAGPGH